MFDMERHSRNTIISIIIFTTITIIIITKVKDASRATMQIYSALDISSFLANRLVSFQYYRKDLAAWEFQTAAFLSLNPFVCYSLY